MGQAIGVFPHALALMAPFFFGLSTWRMEAHVQTHPGKALPLTASQLVVVAVMSALWGILSGGEESEQAHFKKNFWNRSSYQHAFLCGFKGRKSGPPKLGFKRIHRVPSSHIFVQEKPVMIARW